MTPAELSAARDRHGPRNADFAAVLGVEKRTLERWLERGLPKRYEKLLPLAIEALDKRRGK